MNKITIIIISLFLTVAIMFAQKASSLNNQSNRPCYNAGRFYPDNPDTLRNKINEYINQDKPKLINHEILALIAPHAGYAYSGWIAGKSYREIIGCKYDAVIILAPTHYQAFSGSSVYNGLSYNSPLGPAMVDLQLAKDISSVFPEVRLSSDGHSTGDSKMEHAIEVQIPFIQVAIPNTPIVPISMGSQTLENCDLTMRAIVDAIKKSNKKVLIIASTDLSHFHEYDTARTIDRQFVETFNEFDYFKLSNKCSTQEYEACGAGPVITTMMAAEQLGATHANRIFYANSADSKEIEADRNRVVGYLSAAVFKVDYEPLKLLPDLNLTDKETLIQQAKTSIQNAANNNNTKNYLYITTPSIIKNLAAFVTIKKHGELRGCIGHTFSSQPLIKEVDESARLAATEDPRFNPVKPNELDSLEIEITVLSRMKRILNENEIVPGEDGVYLKLGYNSGLFLPVVAKEYNWDKNTLLQQLCRKANLPNNYHKNPKAMLFVFKGLSINENDIPKD